MKQTSTIRLEKEVHAKFSEYCRTNHVTRSSMIENLIRKLLGLPELTKDKMKTRFYGKRNIKQVKVTREPVEVEFKTKSGKIVKVQGTRIQRTNKGIN